MSPVHDSTLAMPSVCSVRHLREMLEDMDPDAPVMVAKEGPGGQLDLLPILSIVQMAEPLEGRVAVAIVPQGALGPEYLAMLKRQTGDEVDQEEPS